jgi:hypothetical protein
LENLMISDHIAILLHSSLDQARVNRLKPTAPASYFVQIAFPPAATQDLHALISSVVPGGDASRVSVSVHENQRMKKPFPGVPADWLIVRASTQYAPAVLAADGATITDNATIRATFYAGRFVRVALSAFAWTSPQGVHGASFNVMGVMDSGENARLAIGNTAMIDLQAHAKPAAPQALQAPQPINPFAQSTPQTTNPFASHAASNPFAQSTAQPVNPFAQK